MKSFKASIGKVERVVDNTPVEEEKPDARFKASIGKVELLILYHLEVKNAIEFYYLL